MSSNLTIESPNLQRIVRESGQFTADAIFTLWSALNDTRKTERVDFRRSRDVISPKPLILTPSASVDNLDLQGCSIVSFQGTTAVNFTGMRAPETGDAQIVWVSVSGTGTITAKNNLTSETANQLSNASGADVALSTGKGIIYAYLNAKWREIARSA